MNIDERVVIAANNNADLYEAVFSAHGLRYERLPFAFVGIDRSPPYYANITTLSYKDTDDILLKLKDAMKRFSDQVGMKDSFCLMDTEAAGLNMLFEASWIWLNSGKQQFPRDWERVTTLSELQKWEDAWKQSGSPTQARMFNEKFLAREDIFIFGVKINGIFDAGCIGNRSKDCIGLSNVFSISPSRQVFGEAIAAISSIDGSLPIVGYESGDDLKVAREAGFEVIGNLRILVPRIDEG